MSNKGIVSQRKWTKLRTLVRGSPCSDNFRTKNCKHDTRSRPAATPLKYPDTIKESDPQQYKAYMESVGDKESYDTAIRNATLTSLLQVVKIREDEMSRKANLTENMTTATGYFTSAGALNWVVQEIEKSLRGEP